MPPLTFLDVIRMNNGDEIAGLIDEAARATPEVMLGAARPIAGVNYQTLVMSAVNTDSSFRAGNEGSHETNPTWENRLVEAFIFDRHWWADVAVADSHEDGWEAVLAMMAAGNLEGGMQSLGKQFYYGTGYGAKGFEGLSQKLNSVSDETVVDATGTSGGNLVTSVYGVKRGEKDVQWCIGQGGSFLPGDVYRQRKTDPNDAAKSIPAYCQDLLARIGLQVGSKHSISRICNLTDETGKGMTDDLVGQMIGKLPAGKRPDVLYMNPTAHEQLRNSRTATNATGAPAPYPTESLGIPIEVTDSIANDESIVS